MPVLFKKSYGLDISDDQPVAVECTRRGKRIIHKPIEPENCRASGSDTLKTVNIGMVRIQNSLTCILEAPVKSERKAKMVFPSLLDMQLPFPLENCVFDFTGISKKTDDFSATVAVAMLKKSLESEITAYQNAGFDPELMDHEGIALWSSSLPLLPNKSPEYRAAIHLRWNGSSSIVSGKDKTFLNSHSLSGDKPEKDPEKLRALASAINQTLFPDIPEGAEMSWFFCGAPAKDKELVEKLHALLAKTHPGPLTLPESPENFPARSLAERALSEKPLNLRKHEFTHHRLTAALKTRINRSFSLLLTAGIALCALSLSWNIIIEQQRKTVLEKIKSLAETLTPDSVIQYGQEIFQAKHAVSERTEQLAPVFELFDRSTTADLNTIIAESKHYNVTCSTIVLKKNSLTISGNAPDWDSCRKLRDKINIPGIQLTLTRRESLADSKVYFTITGDTENER